MTRADVEEKLVESIREVQALSGRSARGLSAASSPLQDVEGFDSLNAIEALCILSKKLKREFKGDINLFVPKTRKYTPISIREVASNVADAIGLAKE